MATPNSQYRLLDREIVLSRVFHAPREVVFRAWIDGAHISRWFGPKGFTTTTHEMDARVGGRWRFDMQAPDGTVFTNRVVFLEIRAPELLVYDHGSDQDNDPGKFRVTLTFDSQGDSKTVLTLRQLHPSRQRRQMVIGFGAVELGYQTLDKLAAHLGVT
jgi:uncharacterized protein YndB with AHSA1/START domain